MGYFFGVCILVYWYDNKERIKYVIIWNLFYNFGGVIVLILIGVGLVFVGNDFFN